MDLRDIVSMIGSQLNLNSVLLLGLATTYAFFLKSRIAENTRQLDMAKLIYSSEAEEKKALRDRISILQETLMLNNNEFIKFREEAHQTEIRYTLEIEKLKQEIVLLNTRIAEWPLPLT